jgi:hypothetical protein
VAVNFDLGGRNRTALVDIAPALSTGFATETEGLSPHLIVDKADIAIVAMHAAECDMVYGIAEAAAENSLLANWFPAGRAHQVCQPHASL